MSNPAYVHENLVENELGLSPPNGTITSDSEDADYPLENLYDGIYAKPFKFSSTLGGYIEIDFGTTQNFDTVAIVGHNLATLTGGTVKADASANPSTVVANLVYRAQDLWADTGSVSARYVRITLPDTNTEETLIGELIIGTRVALPRPPRWGIRKSRQNEGVTLETNGGVTWDYEYFNRYLRSMTFRFPESEYASFELFSTRVQRNPFVFIPNQADTDVLYVKKQRGFDPEPLGAYRDSADLAHWYDWNLSLTGESMGLVTTV